jgi:CubicO group peptidase (beta-lactamase class C family)
LKRLLFALLSVAACACAAAAKSDRVAAVERGLRNTVQVAGEPLTTSTIAERMKHYHVPGLSIAVIDDGRIAWAKGYGIAREGQPVTPDTRFSAGSVSKAVTAVAAMRLVEQERLALDTDVNRTLRSWKLPASTETGGAPVTLRELLSHSGGIGVHAFYPGYEPGKPMPTSVQVLNGEAPAANPPIRIESQPGTAFDYSGGGYQIIQQAMADASRTDFATLLRQVLFDPTGMKRSSFAQISPQAAPQNYAYGYDRTGVLFPVKWYLHPEMAAAGLWTTPSDLARLGIAVSNAWNGRNNALFSRRTARAMLTPQLGHWGLGFQLEGSGRAFRFRHSGDNPGYKAVMIVFPATGQGAVIMTNGDGGERLANEILLAIAAVYGWPDFAPKTKVRAAVDRAEFDRVAGTYAMDSMSGVQLIIAPGRDGISYTLVQSSSRSSVEYLPAGNGRFFRRDLDIELQFSTETPARTVTLNQEGDSFTATRVPSGAEP